MDHRVIVRLLPHCVMAVVVLAAGVAEAAVSHEADKPQRTTPHRHAPAQPMHGKLQGHGKPQAKPAIKPLPTPAVVPVAPKPPPPPPVVEPGHAVPRFASLKSDETNMRVGPDQRKHPIEWVYKRRDLPMLIEREHENWRLVRDPDGNSGWMHALTLSDRRTFIVRPAEATLRSDASETAPAVALLKPGVIGRVLPCAKGTAWCPMQAGGYKGYLRRDQVWGILGDQEVAP